MYIIYKHYKLHTSLLKTTTSCTRPPPPRIAAYTVITITIIIIIINTRCARVYPLNAHRPSNRSRRRDSRANFLAAHNNMSMCTTSAVTLLCSISGLPVSDSCARWLEVYRSSALIFK